MPRAKAYTAGGTDTYATGRGGLASATVATAAAVSVATAVSVTSEISVVAVVMSCSVVAVACVMSSCTACPLSWVDAPDALGVHKPALLATRVQAREVGREFVERPYYVDKIPAPDGDKYAIGLELERGRGRALPNPEGGGKGRSDIGRGCRGGDEAGQGQRRAGRGQQEHAPGVLLLIAHGQERMPLDGDAGGVQGVGERAGGIGRDAIRGQGDVRRYGVT